MKCKKHDNRELRCIFDLLNVWNEPIIKSTSEENIWFISTKCISGGNTYEGSDLRRRHHGPRYCSGFAAKGHTVLMYASSPASAQRHKDTLGKSLQKRVEKGKITQEAVDACWPTCW